MTTVSEHYLLSSEGADLLQTCIHCGLCLQSCPTYQATGKEAESPRGRLVLMKILDGSEVADSGDYFGHIDRCLGCLACQSACPSGVPYGDLLEQVRRQQRLSYAPLNLRQKVALKWTTSTAHRGLLTSLLRLVQLLRLDKLALALRLLPQSLRLQLAGLPKLPANSFTSTSEDRFEARHPEGLSRGTVALFTGCVMDSWYADVHAATVRVLRWNGFEVVLPKLPVCCGALHAHAGLSSPASTDLSIFTEMGVDAVLINSAGCGAHMKHSRSENMPPVFDILEWLVDSNLVPPTRRLPEPITYDAPCHLYHAQSVRRQPIELLQSACENLLPLEASETCCGSAGLYSISEPELSRQILDRKLDCVAASGAQTVATANPGCQMQISGGLKLSGSNVGVHHAVELLDAAYQLDEAYGVALTME